MSLRMLGYHQSTNVINKIPRRQLIWLTETLLYLIEVSERKDLSDIREYAEDFLIACGVYDTSKSWEDYLSKYTKRTSMNTALSTMYQNYIIEENEKWLKEEENQNSMM